MIIPSQLDFHPRLRLNAEIKKSKHLFLSFNLDLGGVRRGVCFPRKEETASPTEPPYDTSQKERTTHLHHPTNTYTNHPELHGPYHPLHPEWINKWTWCSPTYRRLLYILWPSTDLRSNSLLLPVRFDLYNCCLDLGSLPVPYILDIPPLTTSPNGPPWQPEWINQLTPIIPHWMNAHRGTVTLQVHSEPICWSIYILLLGWAARPGYLAWIPGLGWAYRAGMLRWDGLETVIHRPWPLPSNLHTSTSNLLTLRNWSYSIWLRMRDLWCTCWGSLTYNMVSFTLGRSASQVAPDSDWFLILPPEIWSI